MRKMTDEEIQKLLTDVTWGTLCGVKPNGEPYAVEFTCFEDGDDLCGLINPKGEMSSCIRHQPRVCLKVCESSRISTGFRAASFFGTAAYVEPTDASDMLRTWEVLETRMKAPGLFDVAKEKYSKPGNFLPVLRIKVDRRSGVTSWALPIAD